jgi:hypothetical protein
VLKVATPFHASVRVVANCKVVAHADHAPALGAMNSGMPSGPTKAEVAERGVVQMRKKDHQGRSGLSSAPGD